MNYEWERPASAAQIQTLLSSAQLYPQSLQVVGDEAYGFARDGRQHYLLIVFDPATPAITRSAFSGETQTIDDNTAIKWCMPERGNAQALRKLFPWTAPRTIGLRSSFGAGDRLGLAGAAHIQAARQCGGRVSLVLAQQSIREMERTQRTPEEVLDAASWHVFRENYQEPWGADADHLKTEDDVRRMCAAGFTFFTLDPSDVVVNEADECTAIELEERCSALPGYEALSAMYQDRRFELPNQEGGEPLRLTFTRDSFQRAFLKYGAAIARAEQLARLLMKLKGRGNYDLELSVDESSTPTSVQDHFFVASELQKRGVLIQSLAPRFPGNWEKGIDYGGDLVELGQRLHEHVLIARALGPYKLSIHSGSDKFAVLPTFAATCLGLLHEKTAGTWYLQALRIVARHDDHLFREIYDLAAASFSVDRASYHVAADLTGLPEQRNRSDAELESLLDNNLARQMLHVTFGTILTAGQDGTWRFRLRIYDLLEEHEDEHLQVVREYSLRHMQALGYCD